MEQQPLVRHKWIHQLQLSLMDLINTMNTIRVNSKDRITVLLRRYREKLDFLSTNIHGIKVRLITK